MELIQKREEKEYKDGDTVVLETDLSVPEAVGLPRPEAARVNGYYRQMLHEAARYAEKHLYPAACEARRRMEAEGRLMPPFSLTLGYTVTLENPQGAFSLYTDMTERALGETTVLRRADNFDKGYPVTVLSRRERRNVVRHCAEQLGISKGRVNRRLRECCLTPDGVLALFQPGEAAPPESGCLALAYRMPIAKEE